MSSESLLQQENSQVHAEVLAANKHYAANFEAKGELS